MKIKTHKLLCTIAMSLILGACGGGNGSAVKNTGNKLDNVSSSTSSSGAGAIGADTLQSIEFSNAKPSEINLKGTGGSESSLITFRVLGKTGLPVKDINVEFVLNTEAGGLALSQTSSKSDSNGYVYTSVISGKISTTVRVTATATSDPSISTQSSLLVVATGLPEQKSMSLSIEKFNQATWGYDNIPTSVNILLADAYNNPVADGTAVYFTAEGGAIDSNCPTTNGGCSVKWRSQDPRPQRNSADNTLTRILCIGTDIVDVQTLHTCQAERAGRVTILATAIGNESFRDTNSNGIYDISDQPLFKTEVGGNCTANVPLSSFESSTSACDDLPEAYLDKNESDTREADEPFINFITDTANDLELNNYTRNNGIYNGSFCQPADEANGLCSRKSITIRKQAVIVMSCDYALVDNNGLLPKVDINEYAIADCNGNALPVGTKVTVGTNAAIVLGNGLDWTTINAVAGTLVKLTIPVGTGASTIDRSYITAN